MKTRLTFDQRHAGWEVRVVDQAARFVERLGLPLGELSPDDLLEIARRRTGLSDFGDEAFLEPYRVMLEAFLSDVAPNPIGRLLGRRIVLCGLCNRLWIQEHLERHPETREEKIVRPLIILGLPRTGSTLLHRLLAQDPAARPLLTWETLRPARRPQDAGRRRGWRIRQAVFDTWFMKRASPRFRSVHHIDPRGPEECMMLMRNTFCWSGAMALPTYRQWLRQSPPGIRQNAYREYHAQLQLLQKQRRPTSHLLLKAPEHLWSLEYLIEALPDACIVQIHRDPHKVIASFCSLAAILHGTLSDAVQPKRIGPTILDLCADGLECRRDFEEKTGASQWLDLKYDELARDPLAAVRRIYDRFEYPWTDEFARLAARWLGTNPKNKHGAHRYDVRQFGLSPADIDERFRAYCQQYDLERETD
jgi:hypothetical protein